jgi:hypothetical protein
MEKEEESAAGRDVTSPRPGWFGHGLGWWLARKRRMGLAIAILAAAFAALHAAPGTPTLTDPNTIRVLVSLLMLGTFFGLVLVAGGVRAPRPGDAALRAISGVMAGAGVALVFDAGLAAIVSGAMIGALAGYFAPRWIRWL